MPKKIIENRKKGQPRKQVDWKEMQKAIIQVLPTGFHPSLLQLKERDTNEDKYND